MLRRWLHTGVLGDFCGGHSVSNRDNCSLAHKPPPLIGSDCRRARTLNPVIMLCKSVSWRIQWEVQILLVVRGSVSLWLDNLLLIRVKEGVKGSLCYLPSATCLMLVRVMIVDWVAGRADEGLNNKSIWNLSTRGSLLLIYSDHNAFRYALCSKKRKQNSYQQSISETAWMNLTMSRTIRKILPLLRSVQTVRRKRVGNPGKI